MITIVDYGMSNLRSVANAFEAIGQQTLISSSPADLREAEAIVLPGVGAFGNGMKNLKGFNLIDALNEEVVGKGKPFLGICLGMQFLARESTEEGIHQGLGWLPGTVNKIQPKDRTFKVPHMGWNNVTVDWEGNLLSGLDPDPVFYFVHAYHLEMDEGFAGSVTSTCWHGVTITASVQHKNIMGVQFHPEKSQQVGLQLLKNFTKLL